MKNIVLCGFMGCGKSTVGKMLAARCGMTFVDMDQYIEEQAGRTVSELFADKGEEGFRAMEHDACVALGAQSGLVIATGGGAVLRQENVTALAQNSVIVWLKVSASCVLSRLQHDTTRPLLQRGDKEKAVLTLLCEREPLYARAASLTVDAEHPSIDVAFAIENMLAEHGFFCSNVKS